MENKTYQVESWLLLDVVVTQGSAILQLFASKDKTLLIWGDSLLILDLGLDILDGIWGLDLKCDGLASQGLHEDLHTTSQTQHLEKRKAIRLYFHIEYINI